MLDAVAAGDLTAAEAEAQMGTAPLRGFDDLGFARLDTHRAVRTGDPEVVYGAGKTVDQVVARLREYEQAGVERVMLQHLVHEDVEMVSVLGDVASQLG